MSGPSKLNYSTKLLISVAWDALDFFLRIPVLGSITDVMGGLLAMYLWGGKGSLALLEVIDPTDQLDGFIPSLTIIALLGARK